MLEGVCGPAKELRPRCHGSGQVGQRFFGRPAAVRREPTADPAGHIVILARATQARRARPSKDEDRKALAEYRYLIYRLSIILESNAMPRKESPALPVAYVLLRILIEHPGLEGLYHVAAAPIDKHTLLHLLNDAFGAGVTISRRDEPRIDRSLDGTRFRAATGLREAAR